MTTSESTASTLPLWQRAHNELARVARQRAGNDYEEAQWLLIAYRTSAYVYLGYGSWYEHMERLLGYSPRQTDERLRVAEALETLPEIAAALRDGKLPWSAIRELTRVALPETEAEWLARIKGLSVHQVEHLVAGHRRGDRPGEGPGNGPQRHVLRFEVSPEIYATFREAVAKLRRDAPDRLEEEEALLLMARQALHGGDDDARSNYQIAIAVCEHCRSGFQQGRGELVQVGQEIVEMADCDAQHIGPVSPGVAAVRASQEIPPAIRRQVMRRDHGRCIVPGCRNSRHLDVHHCVLRSEGGTHDPDLLAVLCSVHHRAVHRGIVSIEGSASAGFVIRHADGRVYGQVASPQTMALLSDAFKALRHLGYKEGEVRRALDRLRTHVGATVKVQEIVVKAIALLRGQGVAVAQT